MNKERGNNIKLIKIWEILSQETSEEQPMETNELLDRLAKFGIDCTRKTLYRDIKLLNDCGYEIMCNRKASNEYFVVDRKFDAPELRILVDAVQAASFITEKKTAELVDKIAYLGGSQSGEILKRNIVSFNTTKNTNESIYYNVYEIATAITKHKKVEFTYFDYDLTHKRVYRKDGAKYVVNPCATIFSNDNYYLICCDDKHKNISHYRIDRMDKVKMLEVDIDEKSLAKNFDIKRHKKQLFNMFKGEEKVVTFIIDNSLIDVMFDKFGEKTPFVKYGETQFAFSADVQISPQFFGWVCSFGDKLIVTSPKSVVDMVNQYIEELSSGYKKD